MSYLARLHQLKAEKCPTDLLPKLPKPHSGSFGSNPPRQFSGNSSAATDPAQWAATLSRLDASRPVGGIHPDRWRVLLADARWIARHHAETAAAFGWTASDLFGIDRLRGWGGLADRLEGARRLAFTARVAHWQDDDSEGWLWRHTLRPYALLWASPEYPA